LALVGVAVHLLAVLVVTAGLLICVTGCWYAVSRRGLIRMISLLVVRAALRRTDRALRADAARLPRARQPEHPVLIMNPRSGGGKVGKFQLVGEGRKRG